MRRKLVVGNWKMNGNRAANAALLAELLAAAARMEPRWRCARRCRISADRRTARGLAIGVGRAGLLGPRSRRLHRRSGRGDAGRVRLPLCASSAIRSAARYHGESDQLVADKAKAALAHDLTPIVCVGETLAEREAGETDAVVKRQLSAVIHTLAHCISQVVVAYEPVWAIGTGKTASPEQAQAVHAVLRAQLKAATEKAGEMQILYGGSVKADNAATLFAQPDIDGGLIGGASLKAADFVAICRAAS